MATVLRQTTVVRDGMHNAFTDLVYWQGCYWVSYRKGAGHVSMDGAACLSVSADGERFREVAQIKVSGDNRDPKLVPMADGRLAMVFPTWVGGHTARHLQQMVSFSHDGFTWSDPQPIYQPHWWLWRVTAYGGRYYSPAYTYLYRDQEGPPQPCVDWLVSDDLLQWEVLSRIDGVLGGESGIHFHDDGEVWVVTRNTRFSDPAYLSVARPPYTSWQTTSLNAAIHSPVILAHQGKRFVAGRCDAMQIAPRFPFRSSKPGGFVGSLAVWELHRDRVEPVLHIPACGDCAYPGLVRDDAGRIWMSYYSEHAYRMGVFPQRCRPGAVDRERVEHIRQNDVYFAELDLS